MALISQCGLSCCGNSNRWSLKVKQDPARLVYPFRCVNQTLNSALWMSYSWCIIDMKMYGFTSQFGIWIIVL